ncbi:MAG: alpha-xylosidase [Chloroflexi bacterium]|nr:alpha-xylosidase [Chloroflexota bacterium]
MILHHEGIILQKGYEALEAVSLKEQTSTRALFRTLAGDLEVTGHARGILRMRFLPVQQQPDYGILQAQTEDLPLSVTGTAEGWRVRSGDVALEILSGPLRVRFYHGDRLLLQSSTDRTIEGHLRFSPFARRQDSWLVALALGVEEPVYGLGEKWAALNRRGQLIHSWNEDATTVNSELSYKNTPFAWSPNGWGLFVHTPSKVTHGVGYPQWSHRSYILQVFDAELDLFWIAAHSPAEIIERYTHLTGRAALPPRWSYGMWMSRAYYKTAEEALTVAETLRRRQIPSDVILLDGRAWHRMETRFDFTWDPERYPDPAAFVQKLRSMGFRLNLWEYSYISTRNPLFNEQAEKGYLLKLPTGEPYVHRWFPWPYDKSWPHLMPSGIIDFTNPEAYNWFRDQHKALFDLGVSVMKTDYGEAVPEEVVAYNGDSGRRLHNVYPHLYNRCVYEAAGLYSQDEPLVWGRASWAGGQRYPVQWGGDPQADWDGLAASIRGGQAWGMSGGPFYAHDIGGFAIGNPDPELYVRWAQAGIMASHTRFHGQGEREPWVYGEQAERVVREWLQWRYRLIPYLQACALEAHRTGMPVMRSMVLAFPEDRIAWTFENQYMLGGSLLVAPVVEPGGKARFYLPAGRWFDLCRQCWIEGPGYFERQEPLEQIPVFGREGSLLPLGPAVQHTGELKADLDLNQVWVFGTPRQGMALPGLDIEIAADGSLTGLPPHVKVRHYS